MLFGVPFEKRVVATNFARLNTNGSLDTNFAVLADDAVNSVVLQTNGSILIGGFFTHVNGQSRAGLARLNSGGALDLSFNPSVSGGAPAVYTLALQGDGRILVGGSFTSVSGTARTNIARLNTDGSLDTSFKPASVGGGPFSLPSFYSMAIDAQGRIVTGGDFASVNGVVRTNLTRFNNDGTLDNSFIAAAGADFPVNSVVLEKYGRILIGGYFNTVNGVANNYIARLNADGDFDPSFNTGSGASDVVYSVALQSDDKVIIGGAFTDFNGTLLSGIARLQNVVMVSPPRLFNPAFSNNVFKVSVATVTGKNYTLQFKNALSDSSWSALPPVAGDGSIKSLMDPSATGPRRFYRVGVK